MVVVSGSWVKNAPPYVTCATDKRQPSAEQGDDMVIPTATTDSGVGGGGVGGGVTNNSTTTAPSAPMTAKAVLIGRPNSHPFQDRTLALEQPVKVGRSVARARATPTNAIFDCKVLSRHHALLWYDCGKFFLQDTNSSNGTFVNNNRLSSAESDPHEVSSGDIVQFGVDVVENNRKVTHGCIIATLKLYLPDGKEAKASPSIAESSRHGMVPLDELYKLNQIIQEASQREQCLETKLTALQQVVEAARRAADESWQAYVGEERLLSRVAALENQLMQANKGFGDDRLRDEINKLQEDRAEYQIAAKEALRKLHAERLEAVGKAAEQQRARATAEHESMLVKEQLEKAQLELQEVAKKLADQEKKSDEDRLQLEQKEKELQSRLELEEQNVSQLQAKLDLMQSLAADPDNEEDEAMPLETLEKYSLIYPEDDLKIKAELIEAENEAVTDLCSEKNGNDENHINLTVAPVISEQTDNSRLQEEQTISYGDSLAIINCNSSVVADNKEIEEELSRSKELGSGDTEAITIEKYILNELKASKTETKEKPDSTDTFSGDDTDIRTLKYQYSTAQRVLREQNEQLEFMCCAHTARIAQLEKSLLTERNESALLISGSNELKEELATLNKQHRESNNELTGLRDTVMKLRDEINTRRATCEAAVQSDHISSNCPISLEQFQSIEEELVVLKERYATMHEEKVLLKKEYQGLHDKYNLLRDRSHNTLFFYVGPLVLMVLYLLISSMFS